MLAEPKNKSLLTLRRPERVFLWGGAVVSSSLPMMIGAAILWPYISYIKWGCKSAFASGKCLQYWPDKNEPQLIVFPVAFTMLFVTPIVCWICCRYVTKMLSSNNLKLTPLTNYAVIIALKGQMIAGVIHLFAIGMIDYLTSSPSWDAIPIFFMLLLAAIIIHFFVALIVTFPLCLICVSIFRIVALRKVKEVTF